MFQFVGLCRQTHLQRWRHFNIGLTNNPGCDGGITTDGRALIETEQMTRFILRSKVNEKAPDCSIKLEGFAARMGHGQTAAQMARYTNAVQELRERYATDLSISLQRLRTLFRCQDRR